MFLSFFLQGTTHRNLKQAQARIYAWHVDSSLDPQTSWCWSIDAFNYDCKFLYYGIASNMRAVVIVFAYEQ